MAVNAAADKLDQVTKGTTSAFTGVAKGTWNYVIKPGAMVVGGLTMYGAFATSGMAAVPGVTDGVVTGLEKATDHMTSGLEAIKGLLPAGADPTVAANELSGFVHE